MGYRYVEFDGVSLPLFDHSQNHSPMPSEATLRDSIGGTYDWVGSARKKGRKQTISFTGVYLGETEYLVDDTGDRLVDDAGDYLIAGDAKQLLMASVAALMEKKGVRGQLWRERLTDDVLQWKTARLLQVNWPRKWEDHAVRADITCQLETAMEFWHAATESTSSGNASNGLVCPVAVSNGGERIDDARIEITCISGTLTAIAITGNGIELAWTGSLASGETLVIDCSTQTVPAAGVDSYSGFSLGDDHTIAGWLQIDPGDNTYMVTVTGGNATVSIDYYEQFI